MDEISTTAKIVQYTINKEIELTYVEEIDRYFLKAGAHYTYISVSLAETIRQIICQEVKLTQFLANPNLKKALLKAGVISDNSETKVNSSYIKCQITLFNEKSIRWLCIPFLPLNYPKLFVSLTLFSLTLVLSFLFTSNEVSITGKFMAKSWGELTAKDYVFIYCGFFICLMLHEIGHACAAIYHGVKPKRIGFGVYFIFPVFFADVTDSWKVKRIARLQIDFGGIYMQLIATSILIVLFSLEPTNKFYLYIISLNVISIIHSLNPMLKFDGYWLASDFFAIHNLRQQSWKQLINFYKNGLSAINSWYNVLLNFYSIIVLLFSSYYLFLFFDLIISSQFLFENLQKKLTSSLVYNNFYELITSIFFIIYCIIYVLAILFIGKIFLGYLRSATHFIGKKGMIK